MSSTCPHNMAHFGPLTAEICCRVRGYPSKFERVSRVSSLLQRRHLSEANLTLHDVWQSLIYTFFAGSCPLTEFCQVKDSLYVQVLRSPVLAALLHGTPAAGGTQPNYAAWYTDGITSLLQRAPTIFGWAAITLDIGPHSSSGRLCNRADHYIFALWFVSSFFLA